MSSHFPSPTSGDRLALLYQLSQTFNSSLDLDEVLNRVMDEVIAVTGAERGFVMLSEPGPGNEGQLAFKVARGMDQKTIEAPQFEISRGTAERVAREGKPLLTSDAQTDTRMNIRQSVMLLGLRSVLCVPILLKGRVLGIIYVDNRLQAGIFTQDDLELLTAIASSAAVAIENARLYQVAVDKGRMERELQMAHKVQASLLPVQTPTIPGFQFAASWRPAHEVGGDYYDFVPLTGGKMGIVIADVTDKGMPAALFMAFTRTIVRASLAHSISPAEDIHQANRLICDDSSDGLFVSLFYGNLDPSNGGFTYVNAGHNPPLFFQGKDDEQGGQLQNLLSTGLQLGIEAETQYQESTVSLQPGDFIVFYTDGVTDAMNDTEQPFGMDQLKQVLLDSWSFSAGDIVKAIEEAIDAYTGGAAPFDDITILVLKRSEDESQTL